MPLIELLLVAGIAMQHCSTRFLRIFSWTAAAARAAARVYIVGCSIAMNCYLFFFLIKK
jgi:hypothetical protein